MGSLRLLAVALAAGALAVLLLHGCVGVIPPPESGLSDAEQVERQDALGDAIWQSTGLPLAARPDDPTLVHVAADEWPQQLVACMNDEGFENYTTTSGGYMVEDLGLNVEEQQAFYVCNLSYIPYYPGSIELNRSQQAYSYEYYKETLIPCLAEHDVPIFDAPTRADFLQQFGVWNPYWSVRAKDQEFALSDERLHRECPFAPPGVPDGGVFRSN